MMQHVILAGVVISLVFGIWLSFRARHVDGKSTSEIATSSRANYFIFAIGISIGALLTAVGVFGHVLNATSVPDLFYFLFSVAAVSQIATAWIPYTKGWKRKWHHITSWTMAFSLLPLGTLLLVNSQENQGVERSNIGPLASLLGLGLVLCMVLLLMWSMMDGRKNREMLRAQQAYSHFKTK